MHRSPLLVLILCAASPAAAQTPADSARHVLNRLTFGPTPRLIDSVTKEGSLRWADRLLAGARPVDPDLARREALFDPARFEADVLAERLETARRERRQQQGRQDGDTVMVPRGRSPMASGPGRTLAAFQQLTVVRAISARDQLSEVMADFWTNHFNIYLDKGLDRALLPEFIQQTIRPLALGRFEDLLLATARSPAMLFYLDNVRSVRPGATPPQLARLDQPRRRPGRTASGSARDSVRARILERMPTGINENYARELLELHTLGVDGGYTQQDVTEVARILTGWGMRPPNRGTGFEYHSWAHDEGAKTVLGLRFPPGGGEVEGKLLIRLLATHPATMHHVSRKLCARFVADDPPDGCVDDAVRAWEASGGEILAVLRAIVHSPDFWSPRAMNAKVKSPLEFVVSAARALAIDPDTLPALAQAVGRLGQPLYRQASPAGYPEREDDWANSGALLERMNLAVALAGGRIPGARPRLETLAPDGANPAALLDAIDHALFGGGMSRTTRDAIEREVADLGNPDEARALAVGLALGSPEFQRQ
jgi:uncharacterized protein (DUF1800 family)